MISLNFRKQEVRDAIVSGAKTIETRALNPEEPEKYFGNIQVGDTILLCNKLTGEELQAEITQRRVWGNFDELWQEPELLYRIASDKNALPQMKSSRDLKNRRDRLAPGYGDKCEKNGIVGLEFGLTKVGSFDYFMNYMSLIKDKVDFHLISDPRPEGETTQRRIQGLNDEIHEVEQEIKENNSVYLSDELGDILWDYMNLLYVLQKKGYIDNRKNVLQRSYAKYQQRINALVDNKGNGAVSNRNNVKKIQKQTILEEHITKYGNS